MKKLRRDLIRVLIELILISIIAIGFQSIVSALTLAVLIIVFFLLFTLIEFYNYKASQNEHRALNNYSEIEQLKIENKYLKNRIKEVEETLMIMNKEYHENNGSYLF